VETCFVVKRRDDLEMGVSAGEVAQALEEGHTAMGGGSLIDED
jgi:hypothetical protein